MSALGLYLKFDLNEISVYSGFGLNRFHCTLYYILDFNNWTLEELKKLNS
jgi:hypothetical protein